MSIRPSGDTAGGFVFDDFVDKQVVHVSATSFRSGAERVSMGTQLVVQWPHPQRHVTLRKVYKNR